MNDTFLPGSGFDTYESQDKVLMQMDGSTEAAVAVRILQQQGFAVVGAVVLGSSYLWGISQAKDWLSVKKNREGNFLTVAGRASDAIAADMAKSPSNFLRDGVSTAMVVAFAPLSAILLIL